MWAAIQFFSRRARIAVYSSRASRYSSLRSARSSAALTAGFPSGSMRLSVLALTSASLSKEINESTPFSASGRRILTCRPGRDAWRRVHPVLEVGHPSPGNRFLTGRNRAGVLLEGMQQDDEIAGTLVEDSIAGVGERSRSSRSSPSIWDVIGCSGGGASEGLPFRCSST